MAIVVEGYSVVVREQTLAAKYPGGATAYRTACPNHTFCSDGNVTRIGFMSSHDADAFVAQLAAVGLTPYCDGAAEDVALVSQHNGPLKPCAWLTLGTYQNAVVAWLADTEPGNIHAPPGWTPERAMRHVTGKEAKERLEFVRTENGLDVYRDKTTGEELFVGRTAPDFDQQRHNELYERARQLSSGLIIVDNRAPGPLNEVARQQLAEAISLFEEVVTLNPGNWAAMWMLGKVFQRLEDATRALEWFARSHRVNPDQPDVAREASIAAMEANRPADAVAFCERALQVQPADAGLRANLALALLFSERVEEARAAVTEALRQNPKDGITRHIEKLIGEVLTGKRPCPHHVRDVQ